MPSKFHRSHEKTGSTFSMSSQTSWVGKVTESEYRYTRGRKIYIPETNTDEAKHPVF